MAAEDISTIQPMSSRLVNAMAGCPCKYVRNNDFLRVDARSSQASVVLQFTGLLLTAQGNYVTIQFELRPTSDRASTTAVFALTEGFLYHFQCRVTTGTVRRGEVYVKAGLQQGNNDLAMLHTTVLADYATSDYEVTYPGSPIRSPLEGPGFMRVVAVTDPSAGSDFTQTVPTNARWKLHAAGGTYTTSAAEANRVPALQISDVTTTIAVGTAANNVTASATCAVGFVAGSSANVQQLARSNNPISPGIILMGGWTISGNTFLIATADTWTSVGLHVEEYIEE